MSFIINPYAFGGAAPFAPDNIAGLRLWLDADDSATITASGGVVSQWRSKDANTRTFSQATAGLRPTTGATSQNGRNTIAFASDALVGDAAASVWKFLHDGTPHTLFAVFKPGNVANPNDDYAVLVTGTGSGSSGISLLWQDNSAFGTNERVNHIVNNTSTPRVVINQSADAFMPANVHSLLTITADPNNGTATARSSMKVNSGAPVANNTQTGTPSSANPSFSLLLGTNGTGAYWTGELAEILVYEAALTSGQIGDVQAYLAAKWGLTL